MRGECIIGKLRSIALQSDKFLDKRIKEENLVILRNHIPLFYILPCDGDKMLFNELAKKWDISKSSLSDIISKYEKMNLVTKCVCSDDKRSVYLGLTKDAFCIKDKLLDIEAEFLDIFLKNFTPEERAIYEICIKKSLGNIVNR